MSWSMWPPRESEFLRKDVLQMSQTIEIIAQNLFDEGVKSNWDYFYVLLCPVWVRVHELNASSILGYSLAPVKKLCGKPSTDPLYIGSLCLSTLSSYKHFIKWCFQHYHFQYWIWEFPHINGKWPNRGLNSMLVGSINLSLIIICLTFTEIKYCSIWTQ